MGTTTLEPASVGNRDAWFLENGSDKTTAVQLPHDDLTSNIAKAAANGSQNFYFDALPAGLGYINSVSYCFRGYKYAGAGGGGIDHIWEFSGGTPEDCGSNHADGSWTDRCHTNITRPDGGGTWTPADFDGGSTSLIAGVQAANMGASDGVRVTTLWLSVNWSYPSSGFALFVSQWLPPLIAVASHALSRREIATVLASLKTKPSSREDFARIIEAFRVRPRFAF